MSIISPRDASALKEAYIFYRTIEIVLRLRNETVLKESSDTWRSAARRLGLIEEQLLEILDQKRKWVIAFMAKIGD